MSVHTIAHVGFNSEADFWRIRQLILDTYPQIPIGFNREIRWWDGWRFHGENPNQIFEKAHQIHLWQTDSHQLVGAALSETGNGDVCLLLHPAYRFLEETMLQWAENHLALSTDDQQRQLTIGMWDYDLPRRRLLEKYGYQKLESAYAVRRLQLGQQLLPTYQLPAGYTLRTTTANDYPQMAAILNAGFNRTFHTALEYEMFATHSPSFQHELNLVVETAGLFVAHVGVTYVQDLRMGIFEPVCTHPEHRRKGLAQALMIEGVHRLQALGATDAYVETGDGEGANAFYDTLFSEVYWGHHWEKRWKTSTL